MICLKLRKLIVIVGVACIPPSTVLGDMVLFEHVGNSDPTTEDWNIGGSGSIGIIVGPLTNDAGSGT